MDAMELTLTEMITAIVFRSDLNIALSAKPMSAALVQPHYCYNVWGRASTDKAGQAEYLQHKELLREGGGLAPSIADMQGWGKDDCTCELLFSTTLPMIFAAVVNSNEDRSLATVLVYVQDTDMQCFSLTHAALMLHRIAPALDSLLVGCRSMTPADIERAGPGHRTFSILIPMKVAGDTIAVLKFGIISVAPERAVRHTLAWIDRLLQTFDWPPANSSVPLGIGGLRASTPQ
jgi:hypothetical protein